MNRALFVLLLVCAAMIGAHAGDLDAPRTIVDNKEIAEYRGRLGKWVQVSSKGDLFALIQKFKTSMNDVTTINGAITTFGKYIFIPYADEYVKELEAQGLTREMVVAQKDGFIWPLAKVEHISSTFGLRGREFHSGTDMPSPRMTPVVAVMDGRVIEAVEGHRFGFGRTILIEHRDHFYSRYAHNEVNLVKVGDIVKKGQLIGFTGNSGRSTGPHLHFEILYNDIPLNALDFLPAREHLRDLNSQRNWK